MLMAYKGTNPTIHDSVFIVDSAIVIGDVHIGEQSSLWFNAVVRGDVNYIRIGARTNVQDNCTLHVTNDTHPLVIGSEVTIGHNVTMHGCTIKDRCLIGMGAILLDGSVVGEDSVVGAGALVKEGMIIPPRSLVVGLPARVARTLTDQEVARIKKSAANYIKYARDYMHQG